MNTHKVRAVACLTIVGLLAISCAVKAEENPKDLLDRAYKALGGYEKIAKLQATEVKAKGIMYLLGAEVSFTS